MPSLADILAKDPSLTWLTGTVDSIQDTKLTMLYHGGLVTNVSYVTSYIPVIGDIVHAISLDKKGVMVVGTTIPLAGGTGIPKAPTGLIVDSVSYIDSTGLQRGQVTFSWDEVTQNSLGKDIDILSYQIWQMNSGGWVSTVSTTDTSVELGPYDAGSTWTFGVAALSVNGIGGPRSDSDPIVIASDNDAPPTPSTPVVTSEKSVLVVTWDGLDSAGHDQPSDYMATTVHMGIAPAFTPTTANAIETLVGAGKAYNGMVAYGATRYFKLVSYDRAGNKSLPSAEVSQVVASYIDDAILDGASLIDYTVNGTAKIAAGTIDTTRLRVGQAQMIVDANLKDADLNVLRKNGSMAPTKVTITTVATGPSNTVTLNATTGAADFDWRVPLVNVWGAMPVPTAIYRVAVNYTAGSGASGWVGLRQLMYSGAVNTIQLGSLSSMSNGNNVWSYTPLATVAAVTFFIAMGAGTAVFDTPDFRPKVPGVLIQDGAVTANLLAANSVVAGKIAAGAVQASTIDANAINGMTITGAIIATASAGARVVINTSGLHQTNSLGQDVVSITGANGFQLYGNGQHTGARVELDLGGFRCYNNAGMNTINLFAGDGNAIITGDFATGLPDVYPQTTIDNTFWNSDVNTGLFGVIFWSNPGFVQQGFVGGETTGTVVVASAKSSWQSKFIARKDSWSIGIWPGAYPYINGTVNGDLVLAASSAHTINLNNRMYVYTDRVQIYNSLYYLNAPSVTSGAATVLNGSWQMGAVWSLSRLKLEQQSIGVEYEILDLKPKTWIDKHHHDEDSTYNRRFAGFIAENLLELSEANNDKFTSLLDYTSDDELRGIQYDRITAYLIPVVRDMNERLTRLEAAQ